MEHKLEDDHAWPPPKTPDFPCAWRHRRRAALLFTTWPSIVVTLVAPASTPRHPLLTWSPDYHPLAILRCLRGGLIPGARQRGEDREEALNPGRPLRPGVSRQLMRRDRGQGSWSFGQHLPGVNASGGRGVPSGAADDRGFRRGTDKPIDDRHGKPGPTPVEADAASAGPNTVNKNAVSERSAELSSVTLRHLPSAPPVITTCGCAGEVSRGTAEGDPESPGDAGWRHAAQVAGPCVISWAHR